MQTSEINNLYKWGRVVLILLAVFLAVSGAKGLKELRNPDPIYNTITVNGDGEAFAIPDISSFTFNLLEDASTVSTAQEDVTKKMDMILADLKDLGIDEKDIRTSDYFINPKYIYFSPPCSINYCPPSQQKQDGYTVSHTVVVKVREIERVGDALAIVGKVGVTYLSSVAFIIDDQDKIVDEARKEAIIDAKEKAKMLASELGVKLVRVIGYGDNLGGGPMSYYDTLTSTSYVEGQSRSPSLPIGENKISVSVNVTYEIR